MSVGEVMMMARYFKHPTAAVAGVTAVKILPETVSKENQGSADHFGPASSLVTMERLKAQVFGRDAMALMALVGAASATGVVGFKDGAGLNKKITLTNLKFNRYLSSTEIPARDAGGKVGEFGVEGSVNFGTSDTIAGLLTVAADT